MTVGELKKIIGSVSDDVTVAFCTCGNNPYDDYWLANKVVRVIDISNADYDRICLMAED